MVAVLGGPNTEIRDFLQHNHIVLCHSRNVHSGEALMNELSKLEQKHPSCSISKSFFVGMEIEFNPVEECEDEHSWSLLSYGIMCTRGYAWLGNVAIQMWHVKVQQHRFIVFRKRGKGVSPQRPKLDLIIVMVRKAFLEFSRDHKEMFAVDNKAHIPTSKLRKCYWDSNN